MKCKKCHSSLFRIKGLYSDPKGLREDAYCPACNIRYVVTEAGVAFADSCCGPPPIKFRSRDIIEESLYRFKDSVEQAMRNFHMETGFVVEGIDIILHRSGNDAMSILEPSSHKANKALIAHVQITD